VDITVSATVTGQPWGTFGGQPVGGGPQETTVVLHIDDAAKAELQSVLSVGSTAPAVLSAQDLANQYSSAELIAAYQLAVRAGR
jgi:hypothetical protein